MPHYITSLDEITRLSAEKEDENDSFTTFLTNRNGAQVDILVQQLDKEVSGGIDCTSCGNCCRRLMVEVAVQEEPLFAEHFGCSTAEAARYLSRGINGRTVINQQPCFFLSGNSCSIYPQRFATCREFPNLSQPGFTRRLFVMLQYYGMCPIVFNVVEALKDKTGFRQ